MRHRLIRWIPLLVPGFLAVPDAAAAQTLAPTAERPALPASGFAAAVTLVGEDILVSRTGAELRLATYPQPGAVYVFRRTSRESGPSPKSFSR